MRHILFYAVAFLAVAWTSHAQEASEAQASEDVQSQVIYPRREAAQAESEGSSAAEGIFSATSPTSMALTTLGFVVLFAACAVAGWFLFKRGVLKKPFSKEAGSKLKIAESRMLGNRQFLMVVEYEENKILLGVGPGKIDYLTSLDTYRSEFPELEPKAPKSLSELR